MRRLITLFVFLFACTTVATAQTCYKCVFGGTPYCEEIERETGATGCSPLYVTTSEGRQIVLGCQLVGDGQCFQCETQADCGYWGAAKAIKPKRQNVVFRQDAAVVRLNIDVEAIRAAAKVNPEFGYALSLLSAQRLKVKEHSPDKLVWPRFQIDPAFAEFWLNPKAAGAGEYYAQIGAEMADSGAQKQVVEVGYELHGDRLILISISGDPRYKAKRYTLTLRPDQLLPVVRSASGANI